MTRKSASSETAKTLSALAEVGQNMVKALARMLPPNEAESMSMICQMKRKVEAAAELFEFDKQQQETMTDYLFWHTDERNQFLHCPDALVYTFLKGVWARCKEPMSCYHGTHGRDKR
jgi:hypothetical protein